MTMKARRKLMFNLFQLENISKSYAAPVDLVRDEPSVKVDAGVQWRTNGAEDFVCTQWDGEIWSVNEVHPEPVTDTHPYCKCELIDVEIVEEFPLTL